MRMRKNVLAGAALAAAGLALAGCFYRPPDTEGMYGRISVGMTRDEVVKALGPPYVVLESEMFYIYDDPPNPVRFRFVLNDQGRVVAKYFESKKELAKRTEETKGEESTAITPPPPPNEPRYPGGPLPRFEKQPGMP
ncbi:MAG: outer membrane protein assembly factor BamE [Planctomycetes bacterium]|nr:outer membrane protein assembly factor BamE [Planctomycetota bacterium]